MIKNNIDINNRLSKLYDENTEVFLRLYEKHFHDKAPRINLFGIIDEEQYNAEESTLVILKETHGWDNEDYNEGILYRSWLRDISRDGFPEDHHIRKHPQMWYNLGRYILYCSQFLNNNNKNYNSILDEPYSELIKAIGKCAITNVNKVRGKSSAKSEYNAMAGEPVVQETICKEIEIINPKIILFCGTNKPQMFKQKQNQIALCVYHPGARISTNKLLDRIKQQL